MNYTILKNYCQNKKKKVSRKFIFEAIHEAKMIYSYVLTTLGIYMTTSIECVWWNIVVILTRIKNYLRTTLGSDRLGALSMLYIESEAFDK